MSNPQLAALKVFFRSAVQNLEAASEAVVKTRAAELKTEGQRQLRKAFKRKIGGVSVRYFPPRGGLGPAAFVSIKPAFLEGFETGGTISGRLVVLLPTGAKLGFKRPGKRGWSAIWGKHKRDFRLTPSQSGIVVLYRTNGQTVPVYLITAQVTQPKRLDFYAAAARIGKGMADDIQKLVEAKL